MYDSTVRVTKKPLKIHRPNFFNGFKRDIPSFLLNRQVLKRNLQ